jgi:filamentous hemagglutinin
VEDFGDQVPMFLPRREGYKVNPFSNKMRSPANEQYAKFGVMVSAGGAFGGAVAKAGNAAVALLDDVEQSLRRVVTNSRAGDLFTNKFPAHLIDTPRIVPNVRLGQISGNFNYVVIEDASLVVGKTPHTSLTGGAPVQAAGEIQLNSGNVKWIDNASGHYQPTGPEVGRIAESAFKDAGQNTSGKYVYKVWSPDPTLPRGGKWVPAK